MIPQSHAVQKTELRCAGWKYVKSTYLVCENDKAAPKEYQTMFAKQAGSRVVRCGSGHSPMLSQCDMLVGRIVEAVDNAVGEIV